MQELSRLIGTEEGYTDRDLQLAADGAAFVAVYCPTESRKGEAWRIIEPATPIVARYYALSGIEHLVGEL